MGPWRSSLIPLMIWVLGAMGCAVPQRGVSQPTSFAKNEKDQRGHVTQAELQDDLLRFGTQFNAKILGANQALENSSNSQIRYRAAMNRLIYGSNSLDIALGPSPEVNLLDMVTFIELSRAVLVEHWIPHVFGAEGVPLEQAFSESTRHIWAIAGRVLDNQQKAFLQSVISTWRKRHPDQINVEMVRLSAFSTQAGAAAAGLDQDVGGLFASVQQSTQAVDAARLFAERALYYAERAPFLLRLQARLGAHEILEDAGLSFAQLPNSLGSLRNDPAIRDLLKELQQTLLLTRATLGDANSAVKSVGAFMGSLAKSPQAATTATSAITQLSELLKEWNKLQSAGPFQNGVSQMAGIADRVNTESDRFFKRLAWLGSGLIVLFWAGAVVSKLAYRYLLPKVVGDARSASQDRPKRKAA